MSRSKLSDRVELDYAHIGEGQTEAGQVCPACQGGSTQEGSLSVSKRDGVLLWTCHRASCSFKGRSDYVGVPRQQRQEGKGKSKYYVQTEPLTAEARELLSSRFGLSAETLESAGVAWTGEHDEYFGRRVSFPIAGPDSRKRGESYRSYSGATPKAIIHMVGDDLTTLAWYRRKRASRDVVLVEDQVSALKLSPRIHAAALLGTYIGEAKSAEIKEQNYRTVWLALDKDATTQAIQQAIKLKHVLPNIQIVGLKQDIKDMNEHEFERFLKVIEAA